jgi:hypothetical protein
MPEMRRGNLGCRALAALLAALGARVRRWLNSVGRSDKRSSVTLRIATPSSDCARELAEILSTCGFPSEVTRPQGRKVEVVCPDERELESRMVDIVRAVELWLCSPNSPEGVELKGGEQTIAITRP